MREKQDSPTVYLTQCTHKHRKYCIRSLYAVGTTFPTSNFRNVADSVVRCENFSTTRKLDTENMAFLLTMGGRGKLINFTCKSQLNRYRHIHIYTHVHLNIQIHTYTKIHAYTYTLHGSTHCIHSICYVCVHCI